MARPEPGLSLSLTEIEKEWYWRSRRVGENYLYFGSKMVVSDSEMNGQKEKMTLP